MIVSVYYLAETENLILASIFFLFLSLLSDRSGFRFQLIMSVTGTNISNPPAASVFEALDRRGLQ